MRSLKRALSALPAVLILALAGGAPAVAAPDPGASVSGPAVAGPSGSRKVSPGPDVPGQPAQAAPDMFAGMDANGDGVLTRDEFHAAFPNMRQAAFERIDANGDALIDRQEWDAFRVSHGKGGMAGRPGMKRMPPAPSAGPDAAPPSPPERPAARPGILPPAAR